MLAGYMADSSNIKRFFLFSFLSFVIASMLCGMAVTLWQLIGFRILQGICAAFMQSVVIIIAATTFPQSRDRAMGMLAMIGPVKVVAQYRRNV